MSTKAEMDVRKHYEELSPEAVAAGRINRKQLTNNAKSLMDSILMGKAGISSKEDCEKAFGDVADAFVAERVDRFAEVDALDGLPQATKDAIKTQLVGFDKVKGIDPGQLLDEAMTTFGPPRFRVAGRGGFV